MRDMDKYVDRVLLRAVEILETCGWARGSKRVLKSDSLCIPYREPKNPERYWYCPLGAIEQAASEIFGIKIHRLNAYSEVTSYGKGTNPSALTVYRWNDQLERYKTKRKERSESRTPARVLRVMRKAAGLPSKKEGRA